MEEVFNSITTPQLFAIIIGFLYLVGFASYWKRNYKISWLTNRTVSDLIILNALRAIEVACILYYATIMDSSNIIILLAHGLTCFFAIRLAEMYTRVTYFFREKNYKQKLTKSQTDTIAIFAVITFIIAILIVPLNILWVAILFIFIVINNRALRGYSHLYRDYLFRETIDHLDDSDPDNNSNSETVIDLGIKVVEGMVKKDDDHKENTSHESSRVKRVMMNMKNGSNNVQRANVDKGNVSQVQRGGSNNTQIIN